MRVKSDWWGGGRTVWEIILDSDIAGSFAGLEEELQDAFLAHLGRQRQRGPQLGRPHVDTVKGSAFSNIKELRVQHRGDPYRSLFAFDPARAASCSWAGTSGVTAAGTR